MSAGGKQRKGRTAAPTGRPKGGSEAPNEGSRPVGCRAMENRQHSAASVDAPAVIAQKGNGQIYRPPASEGGFSVSGADRRNGNRTDGKRQKKLEFSGKTTF